MTPIKLIVDHHFPYEVMAFNTASMWGKKVVPPVWLPSWLAPHFHIIQLYRMSFSVNIILGNRRTTLLLGLLFQIHKPKCVSLIGYEMVFNFNRTTVRTKLVIALWKIAVRQVDRLVIQSEEEKAYLVQLFNILPHRLRTVPFLSEKEPFVGPCPEGYVFSAGRMERDFVTLLEAVKHTDLPTVIVADETQREVLLPLATPNVQLLFNISKARYLSLLKQARMVIVSLKAGPVSRGQVVLLEAMRYGKPVVYTRTTGAEEYITHGSTGWLVAPASPEQLQELLLTYFPDLSTLKAIGRGAYEEQRRRFSPEVFYKNYHQAIWEVYGQESGTA